MNCNFMLEPTVISIVTGLDAETDIRNFEKYAIAIVIIVIIVTHATAPRNVANNSFRSTNQSTIVVQSSLTVEKASVYLDEIYNTVAEYTGISVLKRRRIFP